MMKPSIEIPFPYKRVTKKLVVEAKKIRPCEAKEKILDKKLKFIGMELIAVYFKIQCENGGTEILIVDKNGIKKYVKFPT